jgi:hypothetical protein
VRGGNSLEGLIGGTPRKDFSCEAETFWKGLSEELLGSPSRVRRKPLKRPSRARRKKVMRVNLPPRNSYVTEKQLQQMKFLLGNITFLT